MHQQQSSLEARSAAAPMQPDTIYSYQGEADGSGTVFAFAFTTKDTEARAELHEVLDLDDGRLHTLRQVHGRRVAPVRRESVNSEADGWLFDQPSPAVAAVFVADCLPVALYAPTQGRAALAHCGHRGLSGRILEEAVRLLRNGAPDAPVAAWLGPCIRPCCYQVQEDVARHFTTWPAALADHPQGGYRLNLQRVAELQLAELAADVAGAVPECTYCHAGRYWSYRRDGAGSRGRQSVVATLRKLP
jgi:YfiH family protein